MKKPLRILHLEDNPVDADLVAMRLTAEWPDVVIVRVESHREFQAVLAQGGFDVVVSDFSLPSWDGLKALELTREHLPDVPFIFCSGTIGEEAAIEAVRRGATDYVIKDRPDRLVTSVSRALIERTERRQRLEAEERIREQAALIDQAQDAIYVCDLADRITFWSRGAERMYGWTPDEAIGRTTQELCFKHLPLELAEAQERLVENGQWEGVFRQVNKEGHTVIVESRWTLLRNDSGQPRARLAINTDVTEKKQLESQLLRTQRLESIGTLASGVAHDLNNSLTPILLGLELLSLKSPDPEIAAVVETVATNARRAASIVRQILSFARGAGGERAIVQLKHLVAEQEKICRDTFSPSIRTSRRITKDLWTIMGDATQIHQVLMNLCVNARDAMPDGGRLGIEADNAVLDEVDIRAQTGVKPGPFVVLTVSDTGCGMTPEVMDKIFDPFFTTKEPGKGTGLGLSTVIGIVRSHGGWVEVSSEIGRGSTFKIYFPASAGTATASPAAPDWEKRLLRGHNELILFVDDHPSIREMAKGSLEANAYRVVTAADGTEGVAIYAQRQAEIALVITDMVMPFLDGPGTIRALQRLNPDVKIVLISGLPQDKAIADLGQGKALSFLQKPFSTGKLLMCVHEMLTAGAPAKV